MHRGRLHPMSRAPRRHAPCSPTGPGPPRRWSALKITRGGTMVRVSRGGHRMRRTDEACTGKKFGVAATTVVRRLVVAAGYLIGLSAAPAAAQLLDLERLDGPTAIEMMEAGELTSVKLVKAYIDRIEALNKRGPGLNAVTQLNANALKEA